MTRAVRALRKSVILVTGLALVFALAGTGQAHHPLVEPDEPVAARPFPPKELENLQVLPADMPVEDLVALMKQYTQALGVDCRFCHVAAEGAPLTEFDFASDENRHKAEARVMIRMTRELNEKYMTAAAAAKDCDECQTPVVTCRTCHLGAMDPH